MKIIKIGCTVVFISSLSACSYFGAKDNNEPATAPTPEEVSFSETVIEEESAEPIIITETVQEPATVAPPKASVTLTKTNTSLKSKQIIDWNDTESGFILFSWVPPKGSSCKSTTFPIKKYQEKHSLTYATRSIYDANHKACNGLWTVEVTEKPNKILANATVQVGEISSPNTIANVKAPTSPPISKN